MEEWHFADILMIIIVSAVIYAILTLVHRTAGKKEKNIDETKDYGSSPESEGIPEDN